MRRSGKTTIAIDSAIQKLFNEGEIYIPLRSELVEHYNVSFGGKLTGKIDKCVIDPDWQLGSAQLDFAKRLIDRLCSEHYRSVKIEGRTISVIK